MGKRQRRRDRQETPETTRTPAPQAERSFTAGRYRYEVIPTPDLPEQERAAAVSRIAGFGAERLRLLRELEQVDETLRPRVLQAVAAGVPYRRIAELTGYSRSAISRWGQPTNGGHEVTAT
ncbi:helix-turn-helix domain-containing protein [Micromonospora carbonacea]|uniref:helix-turn-helix domain-containing protein n=1 Tax=Micromonospora carbonacea TaxID=47853 RepID=UPI0037204F60